MNAVLAGLEDVLGGGQGRRGLRLIRWQLSGVRSGLPQREGINSVPPMAHDSIRVDYNQDLEPLVELLTGVERVGDFVASGVMETPMPKLVIVLPSSHHGGELVVRHAGREVAVDMAGTEVSEVSFAAFHADCEHEVQPITDGNRVCLVYNLIQPPRAPGKVESLRAPDYERQTAAAARLLEEKLSVSGAPAKIAWLLEHQYSPEGSSFAGLKSTDAARAQVLAQAAARADCAAHLGVVHIEESGAAQEISTTAGRQKIEAARRLASKGSPA